MTCGPSQKEQALNVMTGAGQEAVRDNRISRYLLDGVTVRRAAAKPATIPATPTQLDTLADGLRPELAPPSG